jgi:Rieske Fe-S protein
MALAMGTVLDFTGCSSVHSIEIEAEGGVLRVPIAEFGTSNAIVLRTKAEPFDLLAVRYPDGTVGALLMECTHQNTPLTATESGLFCPAHGSAFDLHGHATRGPAVKPLKTFPATLQNGILEITLS